MRRYVILFASILCVCRFIDLSICLFDFIGMIRHVYASHHHVTTSQLSCIDMWGFPEMGGPNNGWFIVENPVEMDDLEVDTPT